ncbi:MAG TPA: prepilin-type N-terminal cleavage/methylation domain-containing protein [Planctomycetota bacterium]|nr:prepilin-type N-terminal cleavage/methylation domain-containing protein [Planctomycetota bacterium]HRR79647.1 prepilin-type N-terminal cleavage/methylation domain-containing protein [Planctomycetota bacterium]HRT97481.1 prepilin-type N-terminal cleavage/methylation domain-containing protein [Planctomycetota bacterium]
MLARGPAPSRHAAAFTLVEMLVVMGIVTLLVALLFPAFNAIRRNQKVRRTQATLEAIASGIDAYQNDFGLYPPSEHVVGTNRGNRSLVVLLNAKGGRSAPYLPSAFYDDGEIRMPLLLDEWERPFIYFDTAAMRDATVHDYDVLGDRAVRPARAAGGDYCNFGRFQLWSCGPNETNDQGRGEALGADDLANFVAK